MASEVESPGIKPNLSLKEFAKRHLAEGQEWSEYESVIEAPEPKHVTGFEQGLPRTRLEAATPAYLKRVALHGELLDRFRRALSSGEWKIRALPRYAHNFEEIAPEALLSAGEVSFTTSRIGNFSEVQILRCSQEDRLPKLKWFIETVCDVVPPKSGLTKPRVFELADRLFEFDVREDIFAAAWADADIPPGYRQPGR